MTDYPNKEHESADKAARRRALKALGDLIDEASLLKAGLEATDPPHNLFASDARRLAALSLSVSENLSIAETLRDVREWHEADQSGAESASQAAVAGDAQPYSGPRYCLFCGSRARWDVSGFLSCSSSVHLGRARDALAARREQEDASEEGAAAELARKHGVTITGSTGVQYGDGDSQSNIFGGQ